MRFGSDLCNDFSTAFFPVAMSGKMRHGPFASLAGSLTDQPIIDLGGIFPPERWTGLEDRLRFDLTDPLIYYWDGHVGY